MAKYLIQDIIPPERKRVVSGERKLNIRTGAGRSIDHQPHIPAKVDKVQRLHRKVESESEIAQDEPRNQDATRIAKKPESNPRAMIVNLIDGQEPPKSPPENTKYFEESVEESVLGRNIGITDDGYMETKRIGDKSMLRNWLPWFIGIVILGIAVVAALNYFGGATVIVSPKKDSIALDIKLSALKNPANAELSFSVMKVALEETREVPATGEKTLTAKAKGQIIIYNTQSTTQRLIKNTRFQAPLGKIYRINDSVNVPGATTKAGKTTPGSLLVTIYADEAGPDYNSTATDFTLPGLKGSATFEKVYARGKGPITGGASGVIKSVSDLDMKNASDSLRVQLETKLRTKARGDLAPSQLSFDSGVIIELEEAVLSKATASSEDKAVVSLAGTLYMITFDRQELTKAVVEKVVQEYKGETVVIANLENLDIQIPKVAGLTLWGMDKIDFSAKGVADLEWSINESEIKKALISAPKQSFNSIMAQFPTVELAKAISSPSWKRSFPDNEKDITIKIEPKTNP